MKAELENRKDLIKVDVCNIFCRSLIYQDFPLHLWHFCWVGVFEHLSYLLFYLLDPDPSGTWCGPWIRIRIIMFLYCKKIKKVDKIFQNFQILFTAYHHVYQLSPSILQYTYPHYSYNCHIRNRQQYLQISQGLPTGRFEGRQIALWIQGSGGRVREKNVVNVQHWHSVECLCKCATDKATVLFRWKKIFYLFPPLENRF